VNVSASGAIVWARPACWYVTFPYACARAQAFHGLQPSATPAAGPTRARAVRALAAYAHTGLYGAVWAQRRHDTCHATGHASGSERLPTGSAPCVGSSSQPRRTLLPERSKLFKSHWSNQWLTSQIELTIRSCVHNLQFICLWSDPSCSHPRSSGRWRLRRFSQSTSA
jgi:hypothetical protein